MASGPLLSPRPALPAGARQIGIGPGPMLTRRSLTFAAACAALAAAAPAFAGDASATAFITAIYNSYKGKDAKGVRLDREPIIRRYFEPFLDAQDWEIANFDIAVNDAAAGKTQATVKFVNLGDATTVVLDLIQLKGDWRIYDITWLRDGKPETLRKIFVH